MFLKKEIDNAFGGLTRWQNGMQKVFVLAYCHANKGEAQHAEAEAALAYALRKAAMGGARHAVALKGISLYMSEVMGCELEHSGTGKECTASVVMEAPTQERLEKMKEILWFEYQNKMLKAPSINPESFASTCAKAILTGEASEDEVRDIIAKLEALVQAKTTDKKVVEWVAKYTAQKAA